MNYLLCENLLRKYGDRKVVELVHLYKVACDELEQSKRIVDELDQKILILEAENRLLKQHDS